MKYEAEQPKNKPNYVIQRIFSAANPVEHEYFTHGQKAWLCPALAAVCVRKGWARPIESK